MASVKKKEYQLEKNTKSYRQGKVQFYSMEMSSRLEKKGGKSATSAVPERDSMKKKKIIIKKVGRA